MASNRWCSAHVIRKITNVRTNGLRFHVQRNLGLAGECFDKSGAFLVFQCQPAKRLTLAVELETVHNRSLGPVLMPPLGWRGSILRGGHAGLLHAPLPLCVLAICFRNLCGFIVSRASLHERHAMTPFAKLIVPPYTRGSTCSNVALCGP